MGRETYTNHPNNPILSLDVVSFWICQSYFSGLSLLLRVIRLCLLGASHVIVIPYFMPFVEFGFVFKDSLCMNKSRPVHYI